MPILSYKKYYVNIHLLQPTSESNFGQWQPCTTTAGANCHFSQTKVQNMAIKRHIFVSATGWFVITTLVIVLVLVETGKSQPIKVSRKNVKNCTVNERKQCGKHETCQKINNKVNCTCTNKLCKSGNGTRTDQEYSDTGLIKNETGVEKGILFKDPCEPNPCKHKGTCSVNIATQGFTCSCPKDGHWGGTTCEHDRRNCNDMPKKHACKSGKCVAGSKGNFTCKCPKFATGKYCEIPTQDHCEIAEKNQKKKLLNSRNEVSKRSDLEADSDALLLLASLRSSSLVCGEFGECVNELRGWRCQCLDGVGGARCTVGCPMGKFHGEKCTMPCPDTCAQGKCDAQTGACNGCAAGRAGDQCERKDGLSVSLTITLDTPKSPAGKQYEAAVTKEGSAQNLQFKRAAETHFTDTVCLAMKRKCSVDTVTTVQRSILANFSVLFHKNANKRLNLSTALAAAFTASMDKFPADGGLKIRPTSLTVGEAERVEDVAAEEDVYDPGVYIMAFLFSTFMLSLMGLIVFIIIGTRRHERAQNAGNQLRQRRSTIGAFRSPSVTADTSGNFLVVGQPIAQAVKQAAPDGTASTPDKEAPTGTKGGESGRGKVKRSRHLPTVRRSSKQVNLPTSGTEAQPDGDKETNPAETSTTPLPSESALEPDQASQPAPSRIKRPVFKNFKKPNKS